MAQIHELLPKVMADVGAIPKDRTNEKQNYKFRGIDDALSHANPALVRHGICVSVQVRDYKLETFVRQIQERSGATREGRLFSASLLMALTFHAPDGSAIENVLAGHGLDYDGDKAINKAMAAAAKYGLFLGLVIPVDTIDDSERLSLPDEGREHLPENESKPGQHAKANAQALSAIRNAPSVAVFNRYKAAAEMKIEQGEWSAAEVREIQAVIALRGAELGISEPEGVDEPAGLAGDLEASLAEALRKRARDLGCPDDLLKPCVEAALFHREKRDPIPWIETKPWFATSWKPRQKEMV